MTFAAFLRRRKHLLFVSLIFLFHLYFRFANLEKWMEFGWDQVDNAWAAAKILLAHKFPLVGMVAKQNSGLYIGPLYYYLMAGFYAMTGLHPIASGIVAGLTSMFSFSVIYIVAKRTFNATAAVFSLIVYTFSVNAIVTERVQWPVNFIAPLSLLIYYFLYKSITGHAKYLIPAAVCVGLMFHIHATAVFFPVIFACLIPMIKWDKTTLLYTALSVVIVLVSVSPVIAYYIQTSKQHTVSQYSVYAQTSYHGFHMRRMMQLTRDAFIKFQSILEKTVPYTQYYFLLFAPLFFLALALSRMNNRKKLMYITATWFLVPWILFTAYSGEITDYYFNIQLYVDVMILGYLLAVLWESKRFVIRFTVCVLLVYYAIGALREFPKSFDAQFSKHAEEAQNAANSGVYLNFTEGDYKSYMYFYYLYSMHKPLPYKL